jgi:hypothetical protein
MLHVEGAQLAEENGAPTGESAQGAAGGAEKKQRAQGERRRRVCEKDREKRTAGFFLELSVG